MFYSRTARLEPNNTVETNLRENFWESAALPWIQKYLTKGALILECSNPLAIRCYWIWTYHYGSQLPVKEGKTNSLLWWSGISRHSPRPATWPRLHRAQPGPDKIQFAHLTSDKAKLFELQALKHSGVDESFPFNKSHAAAKATEEPKKEGEKIHDKVKSAQKSCGRGFKYTWSALCRNPKEMLNRRTESYAKLTLKPGQGWTTRELEA